LNRKAASSLLLAILLAGFICSIFSGAFEAALGDNSNGDGTLISTLHNLSLINWTLPAPGTWGSANSSLGYTASVVDQLAAEIQMGVTTTAAVSSIIDNSACPSAIIYWYSIYGIKLGIPYNQTSIEWALDSLPEIANGIPLSPGAANYFLLHDQYLLYVYYWANYYSYDQTKWNMATAYTNFKAASYGSQDGYYGELYIYGDGTHENYGSRYYDEWAETMQCFLMFYQMSNNTNIDALNQASAAWNFLNSPGLYWNPGGANSYNQFEWNTGSSGYYQYRPYWNDFECSAGFFLQIVLELQSYLGSNFPYVNRLTQDTETRYLSSGWTSYQWMYAGTSTVDHTVVHAYASTDQYRMEATLGAWEALYGGWSNLTTTDRATIDNMLLGNGSANYLYPAWEYLTQSSLYDSSSGMFKFYSTDTTGNTLGSYYAYVLMMMQGTVPITATLAVPLQESSYESCSSMMDPQILSINFNTNTLTLGVLSSGVVTFLYGSTPFNYTLSGGVHNLQFSSDWNSIISDTVNNLPQRNYFPSSTRITVTKVTLQQSSVQSGFSLPVSVTVQNNENASELANVQLFANSISIFNGTLNLSSLSSGITACTVNTSSLPIGNYSITASVTPLDEPNAMSNSLFGGVVGLTYVGDLNGDFNVNFNDVTTFVSDYLAYLSTGNYNPAIDYNHNGTINFNDVKLFVSAYIAYYSNVGN
jgi:hypothetical protein